MFYRISKRILDIVVAIVAIILFSPIYIAVAIAIKIDSPEGPVFADMPKRVGQNGKLFFMYKFRSMIPNAHTLIQTDPRMKELAEKQKENQGKLKIDEDPRITRVGRFVRKTDIDELPQFFNVLLGNMSVVGPRAYFSEELERYKKSHPEVIPQVDVVLSSKPGITGPWQVSGRNKLSIPERFEIDAKYAKRQNVFYDIYIILKTPIAVVTRMGAYE